MKINVGDTVTVVGIGWPDGSIVPRFHYLRLFTTATVTKTTDDGDFIAVGHSSLDIHRRCHQLVCRRHIRPVLR